MTLVHPSRGMRCAAFAFVLALLLPSALASGGRSGDPAPRPLDLFGGLRGSPSPVLLTEVYYRALQPDEYVAVANVGNASVDLSGSSLTDGEGTLTFPAGSVLPANGRVVVAQNSTAFFEDTLTRADFRYLSGNATPMSVTGTFQLANVGDEVVLRDATGMTLDVFAYGASTYAGPGWTGVPAKAVGTGDVARRDFDHRWKDTDASGDWDLVRVWSLGQTDLAPETFTFAGTAFGYVSPDGSFSGLTGLIANATRTIDVEVYTLTSSALAAELRHALARGVRVRILLEGGPVGGIDSDEWNAAQSLAASGADVRFLVNNTTADIQERYRYVHAKYAVFDDETVLVSSENWGPSGYSPPGIRGSRGWSLAVRDAALAAYFERVFGGDFDARRRDVALIADFTVNPAAPKPPPTSARTVRIAPRTFTGSFRVTPVLAPDTSLAAETILGALRSAQRSIHAELFYAYPDWGSFANAYLEELLAAARRGVSVRLLLDSSPPNVENGDPSNNTNTVAYVNGVAANEGLDLEAKLAALAGHGFTEVHNKGVVIDGTTTVVSSINWNRNSVTANREAGLLVENADVAAYFDAAFAWDWKDDVTPPHADAGPDRFVSVGDRVAFSGLGSSDDVSVTNFSWDLDGDGTFDAWGPEVAYIYRQIGTFTVTLHVVDASGNTANASAIIVVRANVPEPSAWFLWILPAFIAVGFFLVLVVRRRRKGVK